MADTKRYQVTGGLTPDSRPDRVEIGSKVIEVGGDPVSLTEKQALELSRHVNLIEVPEGVTVADFGPSIQDQIDAGAGEQKASESGSKATGRAGGGDSR